MRNLFFVSILLFNQLSFGACENPVKYLTEGSVTSCTGYLFSPEEEAKVRDMKIKYKTLEELTVKQEELKNNLLLRIETANRTNEYLNKRIDSVESESTLEKVIYFAMGIALGIGISQVLK